MKPLELIREFVNTADLEAGEDKLADARGFQYWLGFHRLPAPRPPATHQEAAAARAVRGAASRLPRAPHVPAAFALGASFGVLARTAHLGTLAAVVMSATTFAGSAQVATVPVLGAGGGVAAAVAAALLLNARYAPMGISVAQSFRGRV